MTGKRHTWRLMAMDSHVTRYGCACGVMKAVRIGRERVTTSYRLADGSVQERAPVCEMERDK